MLSVGLPYRAHRCTAYAEMKRPVRKRRLLFVGGQAITLEEREREGETDRGESLADGGAYGRRTLRTFFYSIIRRRRRRVAASSDVTSPEHAKAIKAEWRRRGSGNTFLLFGPLSLSLSPSSLLFSSMKVELLLLRWAAMATKKVLRRRSNISAGRLSKLIFLASVARGLEKARGEKEKKVGKRGGLKRGARLLSDFIIKGPRGERECEGGEREREKV